MAVTFPVDADISPASKHIDELVKALQKAGREAGLTEKQIDEISRSARVVGTEGVKNINNVNKGLDQITVTARKAGGAIAAAFALDNLVSVAKHVISITSEFQKLEALLTNTLGSKSMAQAALKDLAAQAARTNFSLIQVTQGYLRLVNNGIKPTNKEMTAFFDLTNNAGKSFDMFTEAINDATRGEFERLKEFFIDASKQGDKVIFTFKGQTFEAKRNAESIKDVLVQLGQLNGVAGSTAAISATLEGRISNMNDALDKLANSPGFGKVVGSLVEHTTNLLNLLTEENLTALQKLVAIAGGAGSPELVSKLTEALAKQRELAAAQKDAAIQSTVNAALQSGNVEAYIKALDQNIYKEEIIALIRDKQKKATQDAADAAKAAQLAEEARLEALQKGWKSAAEQGEEYRKFLAEMRKAEESDATKRISDSVNKSLKAGVGGPQDFSIAGKGDIQQNVVQEGGNSAELDQLLRQESFDFAVSLIGNLADIENAQDQADRQRLADKYSYELSLAGNNEEAKLKLKKDFEAKDREIQNRQAQRSREAATFDIILNTAQSIIKTAAQLGYPAAIPFQVFAGATGLLQLARVNAQKLPRFAEGVYGLDGPGTETSDSILSMLSKNESVVPAHKSRKFGDILKPMIEDDNFGYADMLGIVNKNLPSQYVGIARRAKGGDSNELIQEMKATRKAIENKRETRFTFDEDGFGLYMGKQNDWTKYVSKRYSM